MARNNLTTALFNSGARSLARGLGGALAILAIAWSQFALAQGSVRLTAVEVLPMQGSTLQVRLHTDGVAPQPLTFTIDRPARLSVDLPDVVLALDNRRIDVGAGGVDTIVAAEASGRTRVVFNLDSLVPYSAQADGDSVIVTLGGTAAASRPPRPRPPMQPHPSSAARAASLASISAARRMAPAASSCSSRIPRRRPACAGRQPRDRRLHGRAARRREHEALRRRGLRDAGDDGRRGARRRQRPRRRDRDRRLRAAGLPDRQPVRHRGQAARRRPPPRPWTRRSTPASA